jgi:hypothetical protein
MSRVVRFGIQLLVIGMILPICGCQFFPHNLKPHRLWRLNRMSAPSRDTYFSVSDPIPEIEPVAEVNGPSVPIVTANEILADDVE